MRSVEPCPPLSDGHGNLVTGRFVTRGATNLVEATFSDGTILNGTSIHPVWSLDRLEWVPLGELEIDEQVHSNDGPLQLVSSVFHHQPTDVYNIEVDCEHVYQVGNAGILVHNQYHHLVSHYSNAKRGWTRNWSEEGRQILANADVKLHGKYNLRYVPNHTGPHPELYHQRVFERLQSAVRGLTSHTPAYNKAVLDELDNIFAKLSADPINALKGIGL
ncbi:AHH domain-containing protein [Rhodopirellula sp. UBA1907]|uniref:AHH domain-containing protein n=1 Tax=Rhodopirellula sp. UBA1907 TaxID=1947381 RepID=UPI0039C98647